VAYKTSQTDAEFATDALDDVLQILLIVETIVEEVYSRRRKISLQLTRQISQRLKDWAGGRMQRLNKLLVMDRPWFDLAKASGACQALSTYYYAIMLLSKPFLMYEAHRILESGSNGQSHHAKQGRRVLAEGCVDAACCLIEMVCNLTRNGNMPERMPLIVYVRHRHRDNSGLTNV
jgi:hypothetical protein